MDKSRYIEAFAAEHFTLNGITDRRKAQVILVLTRLNTWLGDKSIESADDNDLRRWQVHMLESELHVNTVRFALSAAKPFYRWLWQRRTISGDQFHRIAEVRPPRGSGHYKPRPYTRNELAAFWRSLDEHWPYLSPAREEYVTKRVLKGTSGPRTLRKHAGRCQLDVIIELALVCGLRCVEIHRLTVADLHPDNAFIVARGKRVDMNAKPRDVPYPESTRRAVIRWFRIRRAFGATSRSPWLRLQWGPMDPLTLDSLGRALTSFGPWELHRLRHTCATERLRAGMEIHNLQRFLGHANITQTLLYAQLVNADIHEAAARTDDRFQALIRRPANTGVKA